MAGLAFVFMLTNAPTSSADQLDLTVATIGGGRFEAIKSAAEPEFEQRAPEIDLSFTTIGDNWEPALQTLLRQSMINDLPDAAHQALNYTKLLVDRGIAKPLDSFIEAAGGWEALGLPSAMKETVSVNGSVYALPYSTSIPVLYVNADLLKEAGVDPSDFPDTWPEILHIARKVEALGDDIIGINLEYAASSAWMFQTFLMSHGGRMMSEDGSEIRFNGPEGMKALELIAEFGRAGAIDISSSQARQAFNAGKLGINVRSASGIPETIKAAEGKFEFTVEQLPIPSEKGVLPGAGNGVVMIAEDPGQQEAAWKYMTYMSGPHGQTTLVKSTGYMPVSTVAISGEEFLGSYYEEHPFEKASVAQLDRTGDWYSFPGDNSARIFEMMIDVQRQLITGELDPSEGMELMVSETNRLLGR